MNRRSLIAPLPDSLRLEAQRLHSAGLSARAVARELKVGATTVQRWLRPLRLAAVREELRLALPLAREAAALGAAASNAVADSDLDTRVDALHAEAVSVRVLVHLELALTQLDRL
jgi:IS30 family transposase